MSGLVKNIAAKCAASVELLTAAVLFLGTYAIIQTSHGSARETIGEIAGWVNIVAYLPYFIAIVKGETKPSKSTWWIWSYLEVIMSTSYIISGAESTKWLPIASFVGMLITAILSIKFGKKEWTTIDKICSAGAATISCIWLLSGNAIIALAGALVVDMFAAIPTIKKSWANPKEEDLFAWVITLVSGIVNLLAIETWNFSIAILPIYNIAIYAVVVFVLVKRS